MWNPFKSKRTYRKHSIKRERVNDINCSGKDKKRLECIVVAKPLIPYFGGKQRVADKIIKKFPKNYDTYVEPFVGGGSVYWADKNAKKWVINDKDKNIVKVYKTAKNRPSKINSCQISIRNRNQFHKVRNKSNKSACDVISQYKTSFGGTGNSFAKKHSYGHRNVEKNHLNKLKKTKILNQDFKSVVKNNDRPDVIQYLDPPYFKEGDAYKIHGVTPKEVCDSVKKLKKAKAIISYDNVANVRKNCKGLHQHKLFVPYSARGGENKGKTELLIANYKI